MIFWVWAVAYLIAGEGFVAKDASEPRFNQPAYLQSSKGKWLVRLSWPLVSLRMLMLYRHNSPAIKQRYFGGQFLPTWFLFIAVGAIGTLLVKWVFG